MIKPPRTLQVEWNFLTPIKDISDKTTDNIITNDRALNSFSLGVEQDMDVSFYHFYSTL